MLGLPLNGALRLMAFGQRLDRYDDLIDSLDRWKIERENGILMWRGLLVKKFGAGQM